MTDAAADVDDIAAALEDAIYKEFKSTDTKYKNRVRSRIANLKVSNKHGKVFYFTFLYTYNLHYTQIWSKFCHSM